MPIFSTYHYLTTYLGTHILLSDCVLQYSWRCPNLLSECTEPSELKPWMSNQPYTLSSSLFFFTSTPSVVPSWWRAPSYSQSVTMVASAVTPSSERWRWRWTAGTLTPPTRSVCCSWEKYVWVVPITPTVHNMFLKYMAYCFHLGWWVYLSFSPPLCRRLHHSPPPSLNTKGSWWSPWSTSQPNSHPQTRPKVGVDRTGEQTGGLSRLCLHLKQIPGSLYFWQYCLPLGKKSMTEEGGQLHVLIKEAKNLTAMKAGDVSDSFVKG